MKDITVLMTGAGAPGAPGIIRSYRINGERSIRVVGVDAKPLVPTACMLDEFEQIPLATDPNFIDSIMEVAYKYKVDVIQPLVTRELELFAKSKALFESKKIAVCVSPEDNLHIANDKGLLISTLESFGMDIPKYCIVNSYEEFIKACEDLGYPGNIVCIKPTKANGSRGFRIIDAKVDKKKILFEQKPNSTFISYDEIKEILSSGDFPELLVMEYMPGEEYSVDLLVRHGEVLYAVPRLRNAMNGGISTDCIVKDIKDVTDYAVEVAEKLCLDGNIGVQVRRARDGKIKILEINPRVQGSIVCCTAAGVNLPYFGIKLALGEDIPKVEMKINTRMIRCWDECFYDSEGRPFTY